MLAAIAAIGVVLSLGTRTPVYGVLFHLFPPMQGLRAAARFGNLFLLGMAVLAGLGLASLRRQLRPPRALMVGVAVVALANLESLRAPFHYTEFTGIPPIYSLLAREPGRVVLVEAPFYPAQAVFENAPYVLASTVHWRRLMNGYSGYTPASYRKLAESFWFFPEAHAVQEMRRAGVTHVMVHPRGSANEAEIEKMWRSRRRQPASRTDRDDAGRTGAVDCVVSQSEIPPFGRASPMAALLSLNMLTRSSRLFGTYF